MQAKIKDGLEWENFQKSLNEPSPISIRINPNKWVGEWPKEDVPWCKLGHYLGERPKFTLDPGFHAGSYYVQEASSMFTWHVLKNLVLQKKDIAILDLCAAPGGKTTLIANFLQNEGLLVANEVIKNRSYILKYNIQKEGYSNVLVSNNDPSDFQHLTQFFDIIFVDAPCSGEGMFRKDPNSIQEWSSENVDLCCSRQKRIVADILPSLKDNGHLIYSTCTYNDFENLDNIHWFCQHLNMVSISIPIDIDWGIVALEKEGKIGYQFYPHKVKGEGFFISILKKQPTNENTVKSIVSKNLNKLDKKSAPSLLPWLKTNDWHFEMDKIGTIHGFRIELENQIHICSHYLRLIYAGISLGTLNKTIFIPDHSLALALDLSDDVQKVSLTKREALLYLKKELTQVDSPHASWVLATFENNGIGWLKNLGNRINNYLPTEHRILMEIPWASLEK